MAQITIGSLSLELNRKNIKNLHVSVLPPDGRVRVSAPENLSDTAIRTAVIHRLPWIKKHQRGFEAQRRESPREMVSGETHFLWGRRYRLEVIEIRGRHEITCKRNKLRMYITPGTKHAAKKELLNKYYRQEIKAALPQLVIKWQAELKTPSVTTLVRKMRTKWGSCNIEAQRIIINSELAKKPPECLDFIVLHEMLHLLERHHNKRFEDMLCKQLPSWHQTQALLNSQPLTY